MRGTLGHATPHLVSVMRTLGSWLHPQRIPVHSATGRVRVSELMTACDAHSLHTPACAVSPWQRHSSIRQLQKCVLQAATCNRPCTSVRRFLYSNTQQHYSLAIHMSKQVIDNESNSAVLMCDAPWMVENEREAKRLREHYFCRWLAYVWSGQFSSLQPFPKVPSIR